MDKKIISIYMGNPDNSNHAELELPATPWEMVDAMDRLRLSEGQEPYWQVEDMGRYEFLAPHLDGYDLYQFIRMLEGSESADPVIEQKLWELSHALEQVDGKHVYAYLPKEVKTQVDEIVEQLAQLPEVAACYEQWWKLKDEIAGYYGRNTPPHQPLVQQKEFRTIKNMIIQQAETICEPTPVQTSTDAEPRESRESSDETPTAVQQPLPEMPRTDLPADAVMQLLLHMSRMFRGNMPGIPPALRIDSKRRRRLQEKRMAMGHKRDDHEEAQRQEQVTS